MKYKIAVFPGDGVGHELINEGIKIIEKAAELENFGIEFVNYPHSGEHYLETKEAINEKVLKDIKTNCNAVYCGTFDNSLKEINIANSIRSYFDQFAVIRPIKLLPSVESLSKSSPIDITLIREATEDFYLGASGRAKSGRSKQQIEINKSTFKAKFSLDVDTKGDIAYQVGVLSKKGCDRIAKFAFDYAKAKTKKMITAVDKANLIDSYGIWRESFDRISKDYEGIEYEFTLIDSAAINFIRQPEKYGIVVAPNMFGDILSDIGTVIQGGLSFAAQGNINPEGISMFEPIHGCAAKLKGQGIVNPIASIWASSLMLDFIGQQKSAELVIKAVESVLKDGKTRTQDLDGNNSTSEMSNAILDKFIELHD